MVRFLFIHRCCIFVFFLHAGPMPSRFFFFAKFVAGLATQCTVKEKGWSRDGKEGWRRHEYGEDVEQHTSTINPTTVVRCPRTALQHLQSHDPRLTSRLLKLQSGSGNVL